MNLLCRFGLWFLGKFKKEMLIEVLCKSHGVYVINPSLLNTLLEIAKLLRRLEESWPGLTNEQKSNLMRQPYNGEVQGDCADPLVVLRSLQDLGVLDAKGFLTFERYDVHRSADDI